MAYDSENFQKPQVDEVGQIILKARELLSDPKRWCKGDLRRQGRVCVVGAICDAAGIVDFSRHNASPVAEMALCRAMAALPVGFRAVPTFNDDPTTTHADVLALLDRAALSPTQSEGA